MTQRTTIKTLEKDASMLKAFRTVLVNKYGINLYDNQDADGFGKTRSVWYLNVALGDDSVMHRITMDEDGHYLSVTPMDRELTHDWVVAGTVEWMDDISKLPRYILSAIDDLKAFGILLPSGTKFVRLGYYPRLATSALRVEFESGVYDITMHLGENEWIDIVPLAD